MENIPVRKIARVLYVLVLAALVCNVGGCRGDWPAKWNSRLLGRRSGPGWERPSISCISSGKREGLDDWLVEGF